MTTTISWPHGYLPFIILSYLTGKTAAGTRVYTQHPPRTRTYPLIVVQNAGLGPLGLDSEIQADQPRLQIDVWGQTRTEVEQLAAQVFQLLDHRFTSGLSGTQSATDESNPDIVYQAKIERVDRAGGGDSYFDEFGKLWRNTAFYNVKVNL